MRIGLGLQDPDPDTFMPIARTRTLKSNRDACRISGQISWRDKWTWEKCWGKTFPRSPSAFGPCKFPRRRAKIHKNNALELRSNGWLKNCYIWTRTSRKTIFEWDLGRLGRYFYGIFIVIWIGGTNDLFGHIGNILTIVDQLVYIVGDTHKCFASKTKTRTRIEFDFECCIERRIQATCALVHRHKSLNLCRY